MKILAIGDFHGKFPRKLLNEAKKVDLIVGVGDYPPFSYKDLFFKYCYKKDNVELWEFIGKKKVKDFIKKDLKKGEIVLKKLNKLKVPVITVTGNIDYTKWKDAIDKKKLKWEWPGKDFSTPMIKKYKNINLFDYSFVRFNDFVFIGMAKSTFPGRVKSKEYKRMKKRLEKLFKKFRKEKIIFVSHNVPYKTKLSKINSKKVPKELKGVEKGSKLVRRMIDKYKPVLAIGGHMHENQGKCIVGRTIVVNPGAASDGKAALIELEKGKVKNVKFLK